MEDARTTLQEELEDAMFWNCSWLVVFQRERMIDRL
jgi:hypothetical protein